MKEDKINIFSKPLVRSLRVFLRKDDSKREMLIFNACYQVTLRRHATQTAAENSICTVQEADVIFKISTLHFYGWRWVCPGESVQFYKEQN